MKKRQKFLAIVIILGFSLFVIGVLTTKPEFDGIVSAQKSKSAEPNPTPVFDQKAALKKLAEQIKGREKESAGKVFKNIKIFKKVPAERFLQVMEFAFARPLESAVHIVTFQITGLPRKNRRNKLPGICVL